LALGAVGGLQFRLSRSAHYRRKLQISLKALRVNNIPTWLSYEEHAQRGLAPALDRMRRVGKRLEAVRARLLSVAGTVERGGLAGQPAVTRQNAVLLRRSATFVILILLLVVLAGSSTQGRTLMARAGEILARLVAAAYARLPTDVTRWIEQVSTWLQSL